MHVDTGTGVDGERGGRANNGGESGTEGDGVGIGVRGGTGSDL